ncbi:DAK2 domain-containing protein [Sphingomonas oryzagri]
MLTVASLRFAAAAVRKKIETDYMRICALDAETGDGDLGLTLLKAFRKLDEIAPDLPPELGKALLTAAMAVNRESGSSFGTLTASALMAVSKQVGSATEIAWTDMSDLLRTAAYAMAARGKSNPGDKTVIDSLLAAADAAQDLDTPEEILSAVREAAENSTVKYRDLPSRIGRARARSDQSVGLTDPGMAAFETALLALEEAR